MPQVQIIIEASIDGHPLPGSPYIQQSAVVTQVQAISVQKGVDLPNVFATIPTVDAFEDIYILLLLNPDAQLVYRFQGQTDAGVVVPAGGMILISGAMLDSGAGTNVLVNNSNSNTAATITGFVATIE
jgi:hypothetical protein